VDRGDERPVDLDFIGGDVGERGKGGIACSEIVYGHPRADFPDHRQNFRLEAAFRQESLFRDFQHETAGMSGRFDGIDKRAHENRFVGLARGNVDADAAGFSEGLVDMIQTVNGLRQNQMRDFVHQSELDRQIDEIARGLDQSLFVPPAQQHLDTNHLA